MLTTTAHRLDFQCSTCKLQPFSCTGMDPSDHDEDQDDDNDDDDDDDFPNFNLK